MSNIKLLPTKMGDKTPALETIDALRKAIEDGTIVGFVCVGIAKDDNTLMWASNIGNKTQLQFIGATAHLYHAVEHGQANEV